MKLASLVGRHRIDEVMKFRFREMVVKADRNVISRYLDIILESGAGPTVQEALKNPALFSMVVQLSALAFAHEEESLVRILKLSHLNQNLNSSRNTCFQRMGLFPLHLNTTHKRTC